MLLTLAAFFEAELTLAAVDLRLKLALATTAELLMIQRWTCNCAVTDFEREMLASGTSSV
jgi:hypothetical protein